MELWQGKARVPWNRMRHCGILVGGLNPVAVDAVLATLIGFDYKKMPVISKGFESDVWPLVEFRPEEIEVCSEQNRLRSLKVGDIREDLCFRAPSGWEGHVEVVSCRKKR